MSDEDKLALRKDGGLAAILSENGLAPVTLDDVEVTWETPEDLSRLSVEAMVKKQSGTARVLKSSGFLRLHGMGVTDHSAELDAVGRIMLYFQSLVTAIGAVIEGHGTSRGKVPQAVIHDTQLNLLAQPAPGSIVLTISPKADEMAIAYPQGESLFGYEYPKIVLADESMSQLIDLLDTISLVDIEPFIERVKASGPRQAAMLKALLKQLADNGFDVDVKWEEPEKPTKRVSLSNEAASYAYHSIENHEADSYEEDIEGEIHTISETKRLELIVDEDEEGTREIVYIKKGDLSTEDLTKFTITTRVRVHVRTTPEISPGSVEPKLIREAMSIERVDTLV